MNIIFPAESDYPKEIFRSNLSPELSVGCARAYFKTNRVARMIFKRRVRETFSLIPPGKYQHALDAGTGAGFLLPALSSVASNVTGIDLSGVLGYTQKMLHNRAIRNVSLLKTDILKLPFPSGTFDVIVCLSVIEHIPNPEAAFCEMGRVLANNGVCIVGYPLEHRLYHFFKSLCRSYNVLSDAGCRQKASGHEKFHPHVSDYKILEGKWTETFTLDAVRNIGIFGMPLYRVMRLIKC